MEQHKNHEIELRGLLDKAGYDTLRSTLIQRGYRGEKDDKSSYFFSWDKGILKVNDEISKKRAKLSLKIGDETKGSLREHEAVFSKDSLQNVIDILQGLGFSKFHKVVQKRENFLLDDLGVEIALKYTKDFQHHFEIEFVSKEEKTEKETKRYLAGICKKLGIKPMDESELSERIREIKKKYGLGEKNPDKNTNPSKNL